MEKLGWNTLGKAFDCTCGERHELPIQACHIGPDAAAELAAFAQAHCGKKGLVVCDENTREAGGEGLFRALDKAGKTVVEHCYPGAPLEATDAAAEAVAKAGEGADFYVGLGAGTLCDLAKSAGSSQGKPVLLFATAASMNGYSSAIVALKVRGLKRTIPCAPATAIYADPEVVATAPQRMTAAGVADFLSKCSSAADWRAAHMLRGGYYCHRPREFNEGIQERLFSQAPAVGRGEPEAVHLVLDALMLSGFGMVIAGSSAPASGGEHLISHYLDMKHALYGTPNDLHGAQVGVATIHTLELWQRALTVNPEHLDAQACAAAQPSDSLVEQLIFEDWGEELGQEVLGQWREKRLDKTALRAELDTFRLILPELREKLAQDLQPPRAVAKCIAAAGGPVGPEEMEAPPAEFEKACARARYLRNRFTVLDLAAELGIA